MGRYTDVWGAGANGPARRARSASDGRAIAAAGRARCAPLRQLAIGRPIEDHLATGSDRHGSGSRRLATCRADQVDLQTNVLRWSDEMFRLFGIEKTPSGEFTYEAFLSHVHPDDRAALDQAYRASIAERRRFDREHRTVTSDGRARVLHERKVEGARNARPCCGAHPSSTERKDAPRAAVPGAAAWSGEGRGHEHVQRFFQAFGTSAALKTFELHDRAYGKLDRYDLKARHPAMP